MPSSLPSDVVQDERLRLIVDSYRRLTGRPLLDEVPGGDEALRLALWEAPRAIVAHGTEADPIFFYGNRLALELFEMSFEEFSRLPSRLSAEPLAQEARVKLLAKVAQRGYVDGYSGMRIASSGRHFMISDCTVWNLADEAGIPHGQAAVFVPQL
ncbi:MEKHLA domain-containing protein [Ferrigenium kumadai]|uniref:MEKHLA domain-containing protein n=1 Tax=Ferrigenium kumadai TaxID=1682490 RepID=A0AAN1W194_9PROT|nr:MEKHLA domain-containing protein [Ferrigenium kumadai]BBJ00578.1 MEKHLA domain-containing protein [Ferrigenium kumadai]